MTRSFPVLRSGTNRWSLSQWLRAGVRWDLPPDAAFADLGRVVEPMVALRPDLDWVPAAVWHLTLALFGNVTLEDVAALNVAVHQVVDESPAPRLRLAGAGTYPESAAATEVFVAANSVDGPLVDLRRRLLESVRGYGWMLDRREFREHLAIARSDLIATSPTW